MYTGTLFIRADQQVGFHSWHVSYTSQDVGILWPAECVFVCDLIYNFFIVVINMQHK